MAIHKIPKVGIYGGTFDPIHYGHLRIAEELREIIGLDQVIFVPSGTPRLRENPSASRDHRLAMVQLAISDNHLFSLDAREVKRPGISTTVESLREFKNEWGHDATLCFILGMDAFTRINQWLEWRELFELCHIIIAPRPGYISNNGDQNWAADIRQELIARHTIHADELERKTNGLIFVAQTSMLDISASHIRSLIIAEKSIRYLLPEPVSDYIKSNHLYAGEK